MNRNSAKKFPKIAESQIQATIIQFLTVKKFVYWRQTLGPVMGHSNGKPFWRPNPMAGFPDIAGIFPGGRMFAIEVKSETGKLSKKQTEWKNRLEASGCVYILARCLQDVIEGFEKTGGN